MSLFKPRNSQPPSGEHSNNTPPTNLKHYLAKTIKLPDGRIKKGYDVVEHCQIVGQVAKALISRQPTWLNQALYPDGSELVAAVHDIGKISPCFQYKLTHSLKPCVRIPEYLSGYEAHNESLWGGHAGVTLATLKALLGQEHSVATIAGCHHGRHPKLDGKDADADVFGGSLWQQRRKIAVDSIQAQLNSPWPILNSSPAQTLAIAGLTCVADWIGSGDPFSTPDPNWKNRIDEAVDAAGFIQPQVKTDLSFSDIFGFSANDSQMKLKSVAKEPGVYILEAPMGSGKTEAALFCAYQLMSAQLARGIYFALPTQLTSNKIHQRMDQFLAKILSDDCPHRSLLVHSQAHLQQYQMGEEGLPGFSWFSSRKRGLLAPFAVGTVDQALLAVMNVKHNFVRAYGLAGKVVILDEIHSYDAYTSTLITALVQTLIELKCTVIILSATLSARQRAKLLGSTETETDIDTDTDTETKTHTDNMTPCSAPPTRAASHTAPEHWPYPLISYPGGLVCPKAPKNRPVLIEFTHQDELAIDTALDCAQQGAQVLWIENTIDQAQWIYKHLASKGLDCECGLVHARFTVYDRSQREAYWVAIYGKHSEKRALKGRILVGTQVLEQSLDIDSDILITRFCPTDMLLQRIGRLHRHALAMRPIKQAQVRILGPTLEQALANIETLGTSQYVYEPYILYRSLEVWQGQRQLWLPKDIRNLIEATYQDRVDTQAHLKKLYHQMLHGDPARGKLGINSLARKAASTLNQTLNATDDDAVSTRYSDYDTIDVLILKRYQVVDNKAYLTLMTGETLTLPTNARSLPGAMWRRYANTVQQHIVRVAEKKAPKPNSWDELMAVKDYIYLGDKSDPRPQVRVVLVNNAQELTALDHTAAHDDYRLCYNKALGYHDRSC